MVTSIPWEVLLNRIVSIGLINEIDGTEFSQLGNIDHLDVLTQENL